MRQEKRRWREVYESREFHDRQQQALHLLQQTDLSAGDIVALLRSMPLPQRGPSLAERMAAEHLPTIGVDVIGHEESDGNQTHKIMHAFKRSRVDS